MIVHSFCALCEHLSAVGVAQGLLRMKPQEGSFRAGLAGFQTPSPSWWWEGLGLCPLALFMGLLSSKLPLREGESGVEPGGFHTFIVIIFV